MTPREAAEQMRGAAKAVAEKSRFGNDIPEFISRHEAIRASAELCSLIAEAIDAIPLPADEPIEGETPETDAEHERILALGHDGDLAIAWEAAFLCMKEHARSLERRLREAEQRAERAEAEAKELREALLYAAETFRQINEGKHDPFSFDLRSNMRSAAGLALEKTRAALAATRKEDSGA